MISEITLNLGLGAQDIALLVFCPICAIIGSTVHWATLEINPSRTPSGGRVRSPSEIMAQIKWVTMRFFIGGAVGLLVALYFLGAISEGLTSIGRILGLAMLLGYSAPRFWDTQEQVMKKTIEVKLGEILKNKTAETID